MPAGDSPHIGTAPAASAQPPRTLPEILSQQAAQSPDATALWWQGQRLSYAYLQQRVEELADTLAQQMAPGERVGVLAWNCPAFVELIYAVPLAGLVLVPLNARLAPAEWLYQLQQAGVTLLVGDAALLDALASHPDSPASLQRVSQVSLGDEFETWRCGGGHQRNGHQHDGQPPLPTLQPDDAVWILFTSGSTGRPKGAVLSHSAFLAGLESAALGRPVAPGDRYFYPFPLFHVAAHNVLLQHRYGAAVVLARSFEAGDTLRSCRELGVTTLSLAPTMIAMLLEHPDFSPADLATVRSIGYGAAAMPESLLRRLLAQTRVGLCQSYGMTELAGSISFLTPADHARAAQQDAHLLRSVGRPLPTAEVRLVDESGRDCPPGEPGEVLVRARQCMSGYWGQPEESVRALADGWLHTGDIGRFDEQGYLYLVDRKKDMIISGGENVASREVEEVLRGHPAVRDCAVIGLPHARWGEVVAAVIQLADTVDDETLTGHCRSQLAGYKTPRRWLRVDALPVNAAGKVDKPALRAQFAEEACPAV
ncbi:class I adenylate-forming enzyme family protein [Parahaliea mediterranea]|uniref:class I adenylate-forming enzyme family protein n=1 Tax=Parahaliea mediterranea TaxID=651086 RepID=UPI000E2E7824|nr:AMP-binding protein [Parahaliea mediterranea]